MTEVATIDVGCGEFGWQVQKGPGSEPSEPLLKDRQCNDAKKKHDVHDGAQENWARIGCDGYADTTITSDSKKIYWSIPGALGDWYQNFQISWIEGCDLIDEQNGGKPIPDDEITCFDIMRDLYKGCKLSAENPNKNGKQADKTSRQQQGFGRMERGWMPQV